MQAGVFEPERVDHAEFRLAPVIEVDVADDEAIEAADRLGPEVRIVTVFPDRMERYFSTELFRR